MPGTGSCQVKCEPTSDEEDNCPQLPELFAGGKLSTEYHSIKLENVDSDAGSTSAELLRQLQTDSLEELCPPAPAAPAATPVRVQPGPACPAATLETLEPATHALTSTLMERQMALIKAEEVNLGGFAPLAVKDEPFDTDEFQQPGGEEAGGWREVGAPARSSPKSWTQQDMEQALDALRNHQMSLTKASATFGIPSTTLWQRAHRLGIDTPKKEGAAKSWSQADLRAALRALRAGAISANKASKAYGIPSSTLYKIARREGIRLAAPFNAAPVAWRRGDLARALAAIRAGAASVQRAAAHYGIPTGTLYGRCKREGIELSRSNPTPWSEDAMGEALEAVRVGQMSINQAAIHYNLPYSSLYGRFKRCKYLAQAQSSQQEMCPEQLGPSESQPGMYYQTSEGDVANYPQSDYVNHMSQDVLQDSYAGQAMYYSQFGIATS